MTGRAKSALFLIEQLIVIIVFALCAAVCAQIFTASFVTAHDARDLNYALVAAKNGAETYRVFGNTKDAAAAIGGHAVDTDNAIVWYDKDWRICAEPEAAYSMRLSAKQDLYPISACDLSIESIHGDEIFSLTVASMVRGSFN